MPLFQQKIYGTAYVRTVSGILKLCEIFFSFIAVILVLVGGRSEPLQDAFIVATALGTIVSYLLLLMYLTRLAESLASILWVQCIYYSMWCIYALVVSSILISKHYSSQSETAGAFGLMSAFAYLFDAFVSFKLEKPPCFS